MKRIQSLAALALTLSVWAVLPAQVHPHRFHAAHRRRGEIRIRASTSGGGCALDQYEKIASAAIRTLREAGPAGLQALIAALPLPAAAPSPDRLRLNAAIDQVAMQKDASVSQLYWYTDFGQAQAAAAAQNKPILSLRMLGKLNEDLSCANSRFFRTTLYANAQVSSFLRENFILHWESVRPVPIITIDMGDGRKVVRTITGNSIHYVLDSRGRVIDGIPGLYGAKAFLELLETDRAIAADCVQLNDAGFRAAIADRHSLALTAQTAAWKSDLETLVALPTALEAQPAPKVVPPDAVAAGRVAMTKFEVERPILAKIMPDRTSLERATSDELWNKIAALHAGDAAIDHSVQALILAKSPDLAIAAMKATASKARIETPLLRVTRNLQDSIALDTVKNEYLFHSRIHEWLIAANQPVNLKTFNDRVYAELFLTPGSDPWLGLIPADTYSALDNGGFCPAPPATIITGKPN